MVVGDSYEDFMENVEIEWNMKGRQLRVVGLVGRESKCFRYLRKGIEVEVKDCLGLEVYWRIMGYLVIEREIELGQVRFEKFVFYFRDNSVVKKR